MADSQQETEALIWRPQGIEYNQQQFELGRRSFSSRASDETQSWLTPVFKPCTGPYYVMLRKLTQKLWDNK